MLLLVYSIVGTILTVTVSHSNTRLINKNIFNEDFLNMHESRKLTGTEVIYCKLNLRLSKLSFHFVILLKPTKQDIK